MIEVITQQELAGLLKESQRIAKDWNTYVEFQQKRDSLLQYFMPKEGLN